MELTSTNGWLLVGERRDRSTGRAPGSNRSQREQTQTSVAKPAVKQVWEPEITLHSWPGVLGL
jgi:hypothetical protein